MYTWKVCDPPPPLHLKPLKAKCLFFSPQQKRVLSNEGHLVRGDGRSVYVCVCVCVGAAGGDYVTRSHSVVYREGIFFIHKCGPILGEGQ